MNRIFSIVVLALLCACSKHAGDVADDETPTATLTVLAPTANASYANGDTIWIKARAVSTATIHGYTVSINTAGDTTKLFTNAVHDHNDTLDISQYWVNNRTAAGALEAHILLTLDHDGHTMERVIPVATR